MNSQLPQHRTGMGIPTPEGAYPQPRRRRTPHVDLAALDAAAIAENEARAAEAAKQAKAYGYPDTPKPAPEPAPEPAAEPQGEGQDISAAMAAAAAAEPVGEPEAAPATTTPEPEAKAAKPAPRARNTAAK